ncbi:MAG TPA: hypothetical protein VE619_02530 [Nitrososphaeraceae archaeon]|nr:hypothetical protein [Nitrososphaeraceae archaeon]
MIVLLVPYFLMVDSAYSQQNAASATTTADSGLSQQKTDIMDYKT